MERWRWTGLVALVVTLPLAPGQAAAQAQLRLSGLLDAQVGYETLREGGKTKETLLWGTQSTPNVDGFVWSPRFITFSAGGVYGRQESNLPDGEATSVYWQPYRILVNVFPQATHAFELQASRATSDNRFAVDRDPLTSTTTSTTMHESLGYRYRGSARLPDASVTLRHDFTESDTLGNRFEESRYALELRAHKSFPRNDPTARYTLQHRDSRGTSSPFVTSVDQDGFTHDLEYSDRIRLGRSATLSPLAQLRLGEHERQGSLGLQLSGPLSPTLDGSAGVRYGFQDLERGPATHVVAGDGVLTRRFSPTFVATTGAHAVLVAADDTTWTTGVFGGASAQPLDQVQASGDFGLQLNHTAEGLGSSQRAHLGVATTVLPKQTVSADYFVSVFDLGRDRPRYVSHTGAVRASSTLIPLTTVSTGYGIQFQQGDGEETAHRVDLEAVFTPAATLSMRAGGDAERRTSRGGGRGRIEDISWGLSAALTATPWPWLSLSVRGRRGIREIEEDGDRDRDVSEQALGTVRLTLGRLGVEAEGFLEREPVVDLSRYGARGRLSYQFRVWRFSIEAEHSDYRTEDTSSVRDRVFVRVSRPVDALLRFR